MVIVKSYYHHFSFQEDDLYKFFLIGACGRHFFLLINYFMLSYKLAVAESGGLQTSEKEVSKYRKGSTNNRDNLYAISHY